MKNCHNFLLFKKKKFYQNYEIINNYNYKQYLYINQTNHITL